MTILDFLSSAGVGALIAGVLVAIINGVFNRGGKRADAAKSLTDATNAFTERVDLMNKSLHQEIRALREAVMLLTDVVDELYPVIEATLTPEQKKKLKEANSSAKLAT